MTIGMCHFCGPIEVATLPVTTTPEQVFTVRSAEIGAHMVLDTHRRMVDLSYELEAMVYAPLRPDEVAPIHPNCRTDVPYEPPA